jgi:uncharacterized protein (DUF2236 family)
MGIFRALGMGLSIVILKALMPGVMSGLEQTLEALFGVTSTILVGIQGSLV